MNIMKELKEKNLKVCKQLDCRYASSNDGKIYSLFSSRGPREKAREVKLITDADGYMRAIFFLDDKKFYSTKAHRVVASCFLGLDLFDKNSTIHHKNGNKADNRVENLELVGRKLHSRKSLEKCRSLEQKSFTNAQKKKLLSI